MADHFDYNQLAMGISNVWHPIVWMAITGYLILMLLIMLAMTNNPTDETVKFP